MCNLSTVSWTNVCACNNFYRFYLNVQQVNNDSNTEKMALAANSEGKKSLETCKSAALCQKLCRVVEAEQEHHRRYELPLFMPLLCARKNPPKNIEYKQYPNLLGGVPVIERKIIWH